MCCEADPKLVTISDLVLIEEDQLDAEGEKIINVAIHTENRSFEIGLPENVVEKYAKKYKK